MPSQPDHQHHVRRVVLPSGKTIEVVYFEDLAVPAAALGAQPPPAALHVCGCCASELVHPVAWEEADATHWEVTLRCPNCGWEATGVYDQAAVDCLDERLDDGTEALLGELKRLARENMEEEIERWVAALASDLVLPEDF